MMAMVTRVAAVPTAIVTRPKTTSMAMVTVVTVVMVTISVAKVDTAMISVAEVVSAAISVAKVEKETDSVALVVSAAVSVAEVVKVVTLSILAAVHVLMIKVSDMVDLRTTSVTAPGE